MKALAFRFAGIAGLVALAFVAGMNAGRAQGGPGWGPAVIHISAMKAEDFPPKAQGATNYAKILAVNPDEAAVQVQMGPVGKHYHAGSNEIQYIVEGSGKFWLGDKQVDVGPGDLIIIPKGTAHGMLSDYKAVSIKSPPQAAGDAHPVP